MRPIPHLLAFIVLTTTFSQAASLAHSTPSPTPTVSASAAGVTPTPTPRTQPSPAPEASPDSTPSAVTPAEGTSGGSCVAGPNGTRTCVSRIRVAEPRAEGAACTESPAITYYDRFMSCSSETVAVTTVDKSGVVVLNRSTYFTQTYTTVNHADMTVTQQVVLTHRSGPETVYDVRPGGPAQLLVQHADRITQRSMATTHSPVDNTVTFTSTGPVDLLQDAQAPAWITRMVTGGRPARRRLPRGWRTTLSLCGC